MILLYSWVFHHHNPLFTKTQRSLVILQMCYREIFWMLLILWIQVLIKNYQVHGMFAHTHLLNSQILICVYVFLKNVMRKNTFLKPVSCHKILENLLWPLCSPLSSGATGFRVSFLQVALAKWSCRHNYNISKVFHKHLVIISIMGFASCNRYMVFCK